MENGKKKLINILLAHFWGNFLQKNFSFLLKLIPSVHSCIDTQISWKKMFFKNKCFIHLIISQKESQIVSKVKYIY